MFKLDQWLSVVGNKRRVMAAQLPDMILLHSTWMDLYTNPLEDYWQKTGKKRPDFKTTESCKRGYVASWSLEHNELILTSIQGEQYTSSFIMGKKLVETSLKRLFPKLKTGGVLANWFSGKLRIPAGRMTQYEHYNYNSRFEKEIIVTIDKGYVIKMVTLDYTQQKLVVH